MRQGFVSRVPSASRGRRLWKRLGLGASLAALSLAASASLAGAVTIGQLAPGSPPPAGCVSGGFDGFNPTVTSGNSYVVPPLPPASALVITSWSHSAAAGSGQTLKMKIFRKVADPATYMVVGHDGARPLTGGALNTFPVSIPVRPGDVLGLNAANASEVNNACEWAAPGTPPRLYKDGDLADGATAGFFQDVPGWLNNVSAVVAPSNTYTLGAISRNKKKGTATITVDVPNPGELTGSGKGVKVAAAAVTSKTVSAPGEVKLTIRAKGKKKRKLNETGKVKVKPKITYTPTGGDPATQSKKLKLQKKLSRR